jgi:small subunit ribosomal protein S2
MADACIEGRERLAEKQQAEADKEIEEVSAVEAASAELKPGERKVISDGSDGPVVEIIKRTTPEAESGSHESKHSDSEESGEKTEVERTGE